jgi:hypothetical protein
LLNLLSNRPDMSSADTLSVDSLPAGPSLDGDSGFRIASAEAKALGVLSATDPSIDGFVGFATDVPTSSLVGVALHEITHAMGRVPAEQASLEFSTTPTVLSLVRYTSSGAHDFDGTSTPTPASYFSIDGGTTTLANFGQTSDPSDFLGDNYTYGDAFNEFYGVLPSNP